MPSYRIKKRGQYLYGSALILFGLLGAVLFFHLHSRVALWQVSPVVSGNTEKHGIVHKSPSVLETSIALNTLTSDSQSALKQIEINVVNDFGAKGDGITDDTQSVQQAIDYTYEEGGGTLVFPPGTYLITSVMLKENILYRGYGATIQRPAHQGKWVRTFTTNYSGETNSQPLIIQGFTFDGNQAEQGDYQNYELEQAHLLFLMGNPDFPGRLQVIVEDCVFKDGVADGISVYTNVDIRVNNCEAINVFRGGFVLTGGNSSAYVSNLTTRENSGIDVEVDGRGYGNSLTTHIKLENLNLIDGDFDIAVFEESIVVGNNIVSEAPFYLYSLDSTMRFTHSTFKVGAADEYVNRIVFPHDISFEDCEFIVTHKNTENPHDFYAAADIWWQHPSQPTQRNQRLRFSHCSFAVDPTIQPEDVTYAIYLRSDSRSNNNQLIIQESQFSNQFDDQVVWQSPI